jgi:serine/threonine protein kinase
MQQQDSIAYKKIDNFYFDCTKPLGTGAFGKVYKAYDERTGMAVAVKVIPFVLLNGNLELQTLFLREIDVLRQLKGNHIVQLVDCKRTTNHLYIFLDYCDGGDLEGLLKRKKIFTEEEALIILKQIVEAFVTLESLNIKNYLGQQLIIMHRDIKPANILFHKSHVKIADFGFAKFIAEVDSEIKKAHTILGTPFYMPPQILNNEQYSAKCDVWSTGIMVYEMLFGRTPWNGLTIPEFYSNIKTEPLLFPKNSQIQKDTRDLLEKMLKFKDEDRICWREMNEHPALKKISIPKSPSNK